MDAPSNATPTTRSTMPTSTPHLEVSVGRSGLIDANGLTHAEVSSQQYHSPATSLTLIGSPSTSIR